MTNSEQFKLVAKILKQYAPGSEDRAIATIWIGICQDTYSHNRNLLKVALENMINAGDAFFKNPA